MDADMKCPKCNVNAILMNKIFWVKDQPHLAYNCSKCGAEVQGEAATFKDCSRCKVKKFVRLYFFESRTERFEAWRCDNCQHREHPRYLIAQAATAQFVTAPPDDPRALEDEAEAPMAHLRDIMRQL